MFENSKAEEARRAMAAQRKRMTDSGLLGETSEYACMMVPSDRLEVRRVGPVGCDATYGELHMKTSRGALIFTMRPGALRRLAADLIQIADESDPAVFPEDGDPLTDQESEDFNGLAEDSGFRAFWMQSFKQ